MMAQEHESLECIIVDDCGSDDSLKIAKDCIKSYRGSIQFTIIQHERNRGLSAARNTGVSLAKGEYIFFLDSDDMLMPDCISLLVAGLKQQNDVDFVIGNYCVPNGPLPVYPELSQPPQIIDDQEKIQKAYPYSWYAMAWNKLIKKQFLLEHNISFVENIIHEDEVWSFAPATFAEKMTTVSDCTYFYNIRDNTLNTQTPKSKNIL